MLPQSPRKSRAPARETFSHPSHTTLAFIYLPQRLGGTDNSLSVAVRPGGHYPPHASTTRRPIRKQNDTFRIFPHLRRQSTYLLSLWDLGNELPRPPSINHQSNNPLHNKKPPNHNLAEGHPPPQALPASPAPPAREIFPQPDF